MPQDYSMNYANDSIQRYSDVDALSTQGRIGRKRYFVYSVILPALIFWAIATVAALASYMPIASSTIFNFIMGVAVLTALLMMVRLTIQRCHDFNKSGAMSLLALIPFANIIFALIPGTNGLNSYGEMPKPISKLFKTTFYALIFLLIALAVYILTQLPIAQYIHDLMPLFK